jgi:hypothetical protein
VLGLDDGTPVEEGVDVPTALYVFKEDAVAA